MYKNAETAIKRVRDIYRKYGYLQFKMNKFEEYDTYVKNKDFLISDKVITFTDISGKLLAMKPDVTFSIIKNADCKSGFVQKVYYNENVYRVTPASHGFKEIMQSGLECIGDIDTYNICEVILLAAKSLECISDSFILDISHMGLVSAVMDFADAEGRFSSYILELISEKNLPALQSFCAEKGFSPEKTAALTSLITICSFADEAEDCLKPLCVSDAAQAAADELCLVCRALSAMGVSKKIRIDFSVVNDMKYYNGFVFKGYIDGVPTGVLSGGQYDRLMSKMGKNARAIGFALYLDLLERFFDEEREFDADVLLYYDSSVSPQVVLQRAGEISASGKTVLVQPEDTDMVHCREKIFLSKEDAAL